MPRHPAEDALAEYRAKVKHTQAQTALIDFLRVDLDLAFTMLQTAEIEASDNPEHYQAALVKVRAALDTIRLLERRIEDSSVWADIHRQADDLESVLKSFSTEITSLPHCRDSAIPITTSPNTIFKSAPLSDESDESAPRG